MPKLRIIIYVIDFLAYPSKPLTRRGFCNCINGRSRNFAMSIAYWESIKTRAFTLELIKVEVLTLYPL
jgi:hypothetical protein